MAVIDVAGFVADLKDHAVEHGFHVHDERHFVESYSLRQTWEVDLHPEEGCEGPVDLYLSLEIDPRVLLGFEDAVIDARPTTTSPTTTFHFPLSFTWALPPLPHGPDLLVLATELAGIGGPELPLEVSATDSYPVASPTRPSARCGSSRTRGSRCSASAGARRCRATRSSAASRSAATSSSTPPTGSADSHSRRQPQVDNGARDDARRLPALPEPDLRKRRSRAQVRARSRARGAVGCPADCPKYERKMIDAGWQYGSLAPDNEPEAEPPAEIDADVAALLDEAENIVNDAGFDILAEEERKA